MSDCGVATQAELDAKIANGEITRPGHLKRYQFIIEMLIILLVVYIVRPKALGPNLKGIKWVWLIVAIVLAVILFQWLMKKNLTDNQWDIMHFSTYVVLGLLVPNNYLLVGTFMICWEFYEDHQGFDNKNIQYIEFNRKKMTDIAANTLGYTLGNVIRRNWRSSLSLV